MSVSAWVFMLLAWAVILSMTGYCFFKLLTSKRRLDGDPEPLPAPPDGAFTEKPRDTDITKLPGD